MQETPEEGMIWSRGTVNACDYSRVNQGDRDMSCAPSGDRGQTMQGIDRHAKEFEIQML